MSGLRAAVAALSPLRRRAFVRAIADRRDDVARQDPQMAEVWSEVAVLIADVEDQHRELERLQLPDDLGDSW